MLAFIVISLVCLIFIGIGISCRMAKEPVGFFTGVKAPQIPEEAVKKYNNAVSILWFSFAIVIELTGIPFLFAGQNSPVFIVPILGVPFCLIAMMVAYIKIEARYKK